MQDFMAPLDFLRVPVMDYSLQPDTLRCNRTAGIIQITNHTTNGYYTWQTGAGTINSANADSSVINITRAGTYIVSASPAEGCPATRKDTVVVPLDTFPPVASVIASLAGSRLQLLGGDEAASNYPTPFGGSQGLLWDWSGPGSFTSTIQNPTNDTVWGTYQLVVTEKRNGCKDTAVQALDRSGFLTLSEQTIMLTGIATSDAILLRWVDKNPGYTNVHEIEKFINGNFATIGKVFDGISTFTDNGLLNGENIYRIKAISTTGSSVYSNMVSIGAEVSRKSVLKVMGNTLYLLCELGGDYTGAVCMYNTAGQVLYKKPVNLSKGAKMVELPTSIRRHSACVIIVLYLDGQVTLTQKLLW